MSINAKPILITDYRKTIEESNNKILYNDNGKYIEASINEKPILDKDGNPLVDENGNIKTNSTTIRKVQPYNFNRDNSTVVEPYFNDKFIKNENSFLMNEDRKYEPLNEKNKDLYNNLIYEYEDATSSYEVEENDGKTKSEVTGKKIKRTLKQKSYDFNRGESVQPNYKISNDPKTLNKGIITSNIDGGTKYTNIQDENTFGDVNFKDSIGNQLKGWGKVGSNLLKNAGGILTNSIGLENSDISQLGSLMGDMVSMFKGEDISTKFDVRMKKLNEWKSQKYKELHPYDWKPGQSVPQDLMKSSLANAIKEDINNSGDDSLKKGFKKLESAISPDPVKYVRNAIKAGKGIYFTGNSLQQEDFGKMKDIYWTSYVTSDKTGSVESFSDKSEDEFSGSNKSLKEKKFIEAIKNRNTYNKNLGYLYIRPNYDYNKNNDSSIMQIPFEFNPQISEGGIQANYATETLLNKIGQFHVYTGTNLSQTSISLIYMALAPDVIDEEMSKQLGKQFSTDVWQYYWTNKRLETIEYKLRSLVFPDMTQDYLVKPPIIEIHLGEGGNNVNTAGDLFKYPIGYSDSEYLNVSKRLNNGCLNRYKKYIVTNVQIEPLNESSFVWPSLYGRKWNTKINNGSPINNIELKSKLQSETNYVRRLGFKASLQCVEVTENFLDLVPDFKAYYNAWKSGIYNANNISNNVDILLDSNQSSLTKSIDELGVSLNTEIDAKNMNKSKRKKLFVDARSLAIIYDFMSTKNKKLYNFIEHKNDFDFLQPYFNFLSEDEMKPLNDLIAFKVDMTQAVKFVGEDRRSLFKNETYLKETYKKYDDLIEDAKFKIENRLEKTNFPKEEEMKNLLDDVSIIYDYIGNTKGLSTKSEYSYDIEAVEIEKRQRKIAKSILENVKAKAKDANIIKESKETITNIFKTTIRSVNESREIALEEEQKNIINKLKEFGEMPLNINYNNIYSSFFEQKNPNCSTLYECLVEIKECEKEIMNEGSIFSGKLQTIWEEKFSDKGILTVLIENLDNFMKINGINNFFESWRNYLSSENFSESDKVRYCDNILKKYNICYNNIKEGIKEFSKIIDYNYNSKEESEIEMKQFLAYSIIAGKHVKDIKITNPKIFLSFEEGVSKVESDVFGKPKENRVMTNFTVPYYKTYVRTDIELLSCKKIEKAIIDSLHKKIKNLNELKKEIKPYDKEERYVKFIDKCININASINDLNINYFDLDKLEESYNLYEIYSKENANEINNFKENVQNLIKELTKENVQKDFTKVVGNYSTEENSTEKGDTENKYKIKSLNSLEESHKEYSKDGGIENVFKDWSDCNDYDSMKNLTTSNDFEADFSTDANGKIPHNYFLEIKNNQALNALQIATADAEANVVADQSASTIGNTTTNQSDAT